MEVRADFFPIFPAIRLNLFQGVHAVVHARFEIILEISGNNSSRVVGLDILVIVSFLNSEATGRDNSNLIELSEQLAEIAERIVPS